MTKSAQHDELSQCDKFKKATLEHECDPDEAKWEGKLRKVVKPKDASEQQKS